MADTVDEFLDAPTKSGVVRARASSRLSFTLIDMNGSSGRRNGMASLSLRDPSVELTVAASGGAHHEVVGEDSGHAEEMIAFLEALRHRWDGPVVRCAVERAIPAHYGFGSKTTTLLTLGRAYARMCRRRADTAELARLCGRGGTSGASVNLIDRGGFLVDGGHANPADFDRDPHRYLLPSRFAGAAVSKPPPLIQLPFPRWPILVIIGSGVRVHGAAEREWFRETMPIPYAEACRAAHLVLMNLAPSIAEGDYAAFCRAVNRITFETHYKQEQIAIQPAAVKRLLAEGKDLPFIDAIGMSVTGPMCFAFTGEPEKANAWLAELRAEGAVTSYWYTTAHNQPHMIEHAVASGSSGG